MRKPFIILSLVLVAVVIPVMVLGCGNDGGTTIQTPEGDFNVGGSAPTEAQLGVSIYPGAKYVANSGGSFTQSDGSSGASGTWTTSDSYDKVVSFYTNQLGEPISSTEDTGRVAVWVRSSDDAISTVTATENSPQSGQVSIAIGMLEGSGLTDIPGP